jgi:hypothetical protein
MKPHRVAVAFNIACSTWIVVGLPNTSIVVLLLEDMKLLIRKDLLANKKSTHRDATHPGTHN